MDIPVNDPPYCRLYIDRNLSRDALQGQLDSLASSQFGDLQVYAKLFKNHGYRPARRDAQLYDPIEASQWTAEVDAEDGSPQAFETFQAGVSAMIRELRKEGSLVTASCDFEDRIIAETGWNWTLANPNPPSATRNGRFSFRRLADIWTGRHKGTF